MESILENGWSWFCMILDEGNLRPSNERVFYLMKPGTLGKKLRLPVCQDYPHPAKSDAIQDKGEVVPV